MKFFLLNFGIHSGRTNSVSVNVSDMVNNALNIKHDKNLDNWSPSIEIIFTLVDDDKNLLTSENIISALNNGNTVCRLNNSDEVFFTIEPYDI
jgi:hypothetical protein